MKYTDFAKSLSDFLSTYLVNECGYSMNTVKAYATTFSLFVFLFSEINRKKINSIILDDITKPVILYFLEWLEKVKGNNVSTMNARLDSQGNRVVAGDQIAIGLNYVALSRKEFELEKVSPINYRAPEIAEIFHDDHDRVEC